MPKYLLLDRESSFMKAVRDVEIDLVDVDLKTYREKGVRVQIAPVAAHNFTGLVERKIRTVQEVFEKIGLSKRNLHATGLQTLCKLAENHLNNTPLGFSYGRDADNSPLLKLVTPNMLRMGRLNSRALDGPMRFPIGPKDLMKKVEDTYNAYFKIWNATMLPKMIPQPKWFKTSDEVKPEDVVYFRKIENDLSSKWTVGQIDSVERSKDGVVRRVKVRYYNHDENYARFSERCVRSLVRLFNIEDNYWIEDMAKYEKLVQELKTEARKEKVDPVLIVKNADGNYAVKSNAAAKPEMSCDCCCQAHCKLNFHSKSRKSTIGVNLAKLDVAIEREDIEFPNIFEKDLFDLEDDESMQQQREFNVEFKDAFNEMLLSMETNFSMEC